MNGKPKFGEVIKYFLTREGRLSDEEWHLANLVREEMVGKVHISTIGDAIISDELVEQYQRVIQERGESY